MARIRANNASGGGGAKELRMTGYIGVNQSIYLNVKDYSELKICERNNTKCWVIFSSDNFDETDLTADILGNLTYSLNDTEILKASGWYTIDVTSYTAMRVYSSQSGTTIPDVFLS